MAEKREFHARTERIEELVRTLEGAENPKVHAVALELIRSVLELHGIGLDRMLELAAQSSAGEHLIDEFAQDDLIASLLLLHDLHPDDIETRVLRALEKLRPNLQSQGADAELLGIDGGIIRLRIHGTSGGGCHSSSAATLKSEVEDAIYQVAPDATEIVTEAVEHPRPAQLITLK
jgi:Fe-S cluster biogenesis protein NfuA